MKNTITILTIVLFILSTQAQELRRVIPTGHTSPINLSDLSPDGKYLLTMAMDNTAIIWDISTGKEVQKLVGHKDFMVDGSFSNDGKLVQTASHDQTVRIWDVVTGKELSRFDATAVKSSKFSADDSKVLTTSHTKTISMWDVKTGALEEELKNHIAPAEIGYSLDGKKFVTASMDQTITIKDAETLNDEFVLEPGYGAFTNLSFNPQGETFLTTSTDHSITVWGVNSGKEIVKLTGHTARINSAGFSPDGTRIISAGDDLTVRVWDVNSGKQLHLLKGHTKSIREVAFGNTKNIAFSTSQDGKCLFWDTDKGTLKYDLSFKHDMVMSSEISDDDRYIYTSSSMAGVAIWDLKTGKVVNRLRGKTLNPFAAKFGADSRSILTTNRSDRASIIDILSGSIQKAFKHPEITSLTDASLSSDQQFAVFNTADFKPIVWDLKADKIKCYLEGNTHFINIIKCSPDDKYIVTNSNVYNPPTQAEIQEATQAQLQSGELYKRINPVTIIWDAATGKELHRLKGHKRNVNAVNFSADGTLLVTASDDTTARIWETKSGKELHVFKNENLVKLEQAKLSPDNKTIAFHNFRGEVVFVDVESNEVVGGFKENAIVRVLKFMKSGDSCLITSSDGIARITDARGNVLKEYIGHKEGIILAQFTPDEKKLVTASRDNTVSVWDVESGKQLHKLKGHTNLISGLDISADGRFIVSSGWDHKMILWDLNSGDEIFSRVQMENNNWMVLVPNSKYYSCTKEASKLMHYVNDSMQVITFEQLDPVYNRPDIVLGHISKYIEEVDQGLIDNYKGAWEKRISRLGLNKAQLGTEKIVVPNAEITNASSLDYDNTSGEVTLNISAKDEEYMLKRFNVLVDEVPLFGSSGISLSSRAVKTFDTTLVIPLSVDQNKIQVSVLNESGFENFKYPTVVRYQPKEPITPKTLFVGIAVDKFENSTYNLSYCEKDVTDLSNVFKEDINSEILLLKNEEVTRENVLGLKEVLAATSIHDRVVISCSSHGNLDEDQQFYLATHDMDFDNPEKRGIPYSELQGLLDSIPARKRLLLLDACNSGITDAEIKESESDMIAEAEIGSRGARPVNRSTTASNNEFQTMMELFVNVQNETGAIVVSAAGGAEAAFEGITVNGNKLENGVFTHTILEYIALHQGEAITVTELKKYVEDRVEELTKGMQKPTSRQDTMEVDWMLFGER